MPFEPNYKLGQSNVIDLWPVKFYQRSLSNIEEPNSALLKIIRDLDKSHRNVTIEYRDHNLLNIDTPGTNWLRSEVNHSVIDYFRTIGIDYPVNWQIHAWSNINRKGDYHDTHNHPHSYLSGTYYLKVPGILKNLPNRSDVRPNHITFYDPRPGVNMNSINKDPYIDPEYTIYPKVGDLLMWPAFLNHFVHPNLNDKTRISLSFNIILKWSDDYLPIQ
jgi:uncharacterized protein (TIGR02466 family)